MKKLAIVLIISILLTACGSIPKEYLEDVELFTKEGNRLTIMTEQGVNYKDYSKQLIEVKSTFSMIEGNSMEKLNPMLSQFEIAIIGWDGAKDIWQYKIDGGECFSQTKKMQEYSSFVALYLTMDETKDLQGIYNETCEDYISVMFSGATAHYEKGIEEYLKLK